MRTYDAWFPRYALGNRLMFFCRVFLPAVRRGSSACQLFSPAARKGLKAEVFHDFNKISSPFDVFEKVMQLENLLLL